MPCATTLEEEFNQYKSALMTLQERVQHIKHGTTTETSSALNEVQQTIGMLERFSVRKESSLAILRMAERSVSLIKRIGQHCDNLTSH